MQWDAIEYRLTGSDPLVCVQWDGFIGEWRVLDTDKSFADVEDAKTYAMTIAIPEKLAECDCCKAMVPADEISRCIAAGGVETFACDKCRGVHAS